MYAAEPDSAREIVHASSSPRSTHLDPFTKATCQRDRDPGSWPHGFRQRRSCRRGMADGRPEGMRGPIPLALATILLTTLATAEAASLPVHCAAPGSPRYALTYAAPGVAPHPALKHGDANAILDLAGIGRSVGRLAGDGSHWLTLKWLRARAEHGDRIAQYDLGVRHALGQGFRRSDARAAKWFRAAAAQGDPAAANDLGVLAAEGSGVPQSYSNAKRWFEAAARQDFPEAQYNLGVLFARGKGLPRSSVLAAVWFKRAAEQGLAAAQRALANLLAQGAPGIQRDAPTAYFWLVLVKAAMPPTDSRLGCLNVQMRSLESEIGFTATEAAQRTALSWWRAHRDLMQAQ